MRTEAAAAALGEVDGGPEGNVTGRTRALAPEASRCANPTTATGKTDRTRPTAAQPAPLDPMTGPRLSPAIRCASGCPQRRRRSGFCGYRRAGAQASVAYMKPLILLDI